jgi:dipeptidyl aminopeptidase/acylaminoacyl peptidase
MATETFLQQLLTLPTVMSAQVSPDGRLIAFVWYRKHTAPDVFVVPADGSASPYPMTNTNQASQMVSWAADSRSIIVAEDRDGDERVRLFRVELEHPGRLDRLTDDQPDYYIRGGQLAPDAQTLFYSMNYDAEQAQVIEQTWVYAHNLESGERRVLARPQRPGSGAPQLSRNGERLIYNCKDYHPDGSQVHLIDLAAGSDRELLHFGERVKVSAAWLPDSERLVVLSESRDGQVQQHRSLGIYTLENGRMHWLIDDPQRNIEGFRVSPDGMIVVLGVQNARITASTLDPDSGAEQFFPHLPGNLEPLGRSADGNWVARYYASSAPAELVHFVLEKGSAEEFESLTQLWEQTRLNPGQLISAEEFHWTSHDGTRVQGWLYRSLPNPQRAIIYIHGGPTSHSENAFNSEIQYLVSQGFNVLDVNYRGSTGFSVAYRDAIKADGWGGREQEDIVSGAEALIRAGLAEAGRIGVTGTSYGGYSAWCQITRYPTDLIAAAAPICGMTDLVLDYNTTRPDLRPYSEEMIGGSPDQVPDKYFERSPINFVQHIQGRLLIVQGARDPNVTPENMTRVVEKLNEYHISHEVLVFDDEGHGIKKRANQEQLYLKLVAFFRAALG